MATKVVVGSGDNIDLSSNILITQEEVDRYVNACLRDSCTLVRDYAKENHRYKNRSGELTRAIRFRVIDKVKRGEVYIKDSDLKDSKGKQTPYGTYINNGTGPTMVNREIFPVRAKALKWFDKRLGRAIFATRVHQHYKKKGIKAEHFLENAFDACKGEIDRIFEEGLGDLLSGKFK